MYRVELLAGDRDRPTDRVMAESYVRFALEIRDMGEIGFFSRFAGETARVLRGFTLTPDEIGRRVFDLHQRHARAIGEVLEQAVVQFRADLVRKALPPSSLLVMTVSSGNAKAVPIFKTDADPVQQWMDEVETERADRVPARRPLHLAMDETTGQVLIRDLVRLGNADSELVRNLHSTLEQDLSEGRIPENHRYRTAVELAKDLKIDEPTVRRRVARCRETVRSAYSARFGQDPPDDLLIENRARRGYRLNPQVRFVSLAEIEQSASMSHMPSPHVTHRVSPN